VVGQDLLGSDHYLLAPTSELAAMAAKGPLAIVPGRGQAAALAGIPVTAARA